MGRVLDIYDDNGTLLKERGYRSLVPLWVKEAGDPTGAPDDLFGLVQDLPDGRILRKFACTDRANTILSVVYFRETGRFLEPGLRKTAARKLAAACMWYGMNPPADLLKQSDVSGTDVAPYSPTPNSLPAKRRELERGIQAIKVTPDNQKKQAGGAMEEKVASSSRFADVLGERFPLDSVVDVQQANAYMDKYASEIEPRRRRRMAGEIQKRAAELHLPVGRAVRDLTFVKVASPDTIRGHLEVRRHFYGEETEPARMFAQLKTKVGSVRPAVLAETIAQIDEQYDGHHQWGVHIPDPWDVVFEKVSQDASNPGTYSYDLGNKRISGDDLVRLSKMGRQQLVARFGAEFAEQFTDDPVGFFDHLPTPEKRVLANMAHDTYSPPAMSVISS